MLSAALRDKGHTTRVFDFAILPPADRTWENLQRELIAFAPDLVGLSVYTASVSSAMRLGRQAHELLRVPIVVGGPHATLNPDKMAAHEFVNTVVTGDGEDVLPQIASDPAGFAGRVVQGGQIDVNAVPRADFTGFFRGDQIRTYPLMTSRGCPFNCSFCTVHTVTSRRWRRRSLDAVFSELDAARAEFPQLQRIEIHDDCPTTDVARFKTFLRGVIARQLPLDLQVANIRADSVDAELVQLLLAARNPSICIAVEHGNPEVYEFINKGETLEEIERAARIIKSEGADLRLCFVIGLPKDNLVRIRDSIRLAQRLRPSLIYWNMAHPFRHTRIRDWYEANGGVIRDDDDHASYTEPRLTCDDPIVSTPDFTAEERQRAKFLCVVETDQYSLKKEGLGKLLSLAWQYGFLWPAIKSALRKRYQRLRGQRAI